LLADYEEGTWTPTDTSGAGLTFSDKAGLYTKIGRMVYWQMLVVYPTTASAANSLIGGLPFTISDGAIGEGRAGAFVSFDNAALVSQVYQAGTSIFPYEPDFVRSTNASLSSKTLYFAGFYTV
jgi:hypothetical protein